MPATSLPIRQKPDPLVHSGSKPTWGQIARLCGDRVAILFEELRRRVAHILGLMEDLCLDETSLTWTPRYRVNGRAIFVVEISPGALEAQMELTRAESEKLAASRKLSRRAKSWLDAARAGSSPFRVRLSNSADVSSLAGLASQLSKTRQ